jgi:hypothetical protein
MITRERAHFHRSPLQSSHLGIETLRKLLPKSILGPPRHSLPIPYPVPNPALRVHSGAAGDSSVSIIPNRPIPNVHYAPLHVKGITTTMPVDNTARKKVRLEEVRKKRKERKEMKKVENAEKERKAGIALREELKGQKRLKKRKIQDTQGTEDAVV